MDDYINLQKPKTGKIYGMIKSGANKTDIKAIKILQGQGLNEHEILRECGVNYTTIRSFMKINDPDFKETAVPVNSETQHLHDRIAELEASGNKEREENIRLKSRLLTSGTAPGENASRPRGRPSKDAA